MCVCRGRGQGAQSCAAVTNEICVSSVAPLRVRSHQREAPGKQPTSQGHQGSLRKLHIHLLPGPSLSTHSHLDKAWLSITIATNLLTGLSFHKVTLICFKRRKKTRLIKRSYKTVIKQMIAILRPNADSTMASELDCLSFLQQVQILNST